jgi:hypothetical protein
MTSQRVLKFHVKNPKSGVREQGADNRRKGIADKTGGIRYPSRRKIPADGIFGDMFMVPCSNHGTHQSQPKEHLTDQGVYPDQANSKDIPEQDLDEGKKDHAHEDEHENSVFKPCEKSRGTPFFFRHLAIPLQREFSGIRKYIAAIS